MKEGGSDANLNEEKDLEVKHYRFLNKFFNNVAIVTSIGQETVGELHIMYRNPDEDKQEEEEA